MHHRQVNVSVCSNICLFLFFISLFGFMPTTLDLDQVIWVASTLLLCFCTLLDVRNGKIKLYIGNSLLLFFIVIAFGVLSILWSAYSTTHMMDYLRTRFPVIILGTVCVGAYMYDEKSTYKIFTMMVWAAVIAALRFCYYTPWSTYYRGDFGILLDPNINYNTYTTPLCLAFIISAYYSLSKKKKMMLLPMMILAAVSVLAGSRKTIVVLPVIIVLYLVNQSNIKDCVKGILGAIVLVAVLVGVIMNVEFLSGIKESLLNAIKAYLFGETENIGNSAEGRMYLIDTAMEVWFEHPILGIGWNNFRYCNELGLYSHNNYVETLACLGIVGFILYYCQHIRACLLTFTRKNYLSKLILGILIGILIMEIGTIPLYSREPMMIYLIILTAYDRTTNEGVSVSI